MSLLGLRGVMFAAKGNGEEEMYKELYSGLVGRTISGDVVDTVSTAVGSNAFNGCNALTGMSMPNVVSIINGSNFWACTSMVEFSAPNATVFGAQVFYYCTALTKVTLGDVGGGTSPNIFNTCTSLADVYFTKITCATCKTRSGFPWTSNTTLGARVYHCTDGKLVYNSGTGQWVQVAE